MTDVNRLFVLLCGYEVLPKTISTRDRGGRFIIAEPVCAYLIDTRAGWVLLDTGINPGYCNDAVLREREFLRHGWSPPVVRPDHALETQMAVVGVTPAEIAHVVLSHLHFDHGDRPERFVNARVSIQRREHAWAFGPTPGPGYIPDNYADARVDWDLRDGDWDLMPGISLLDTRGHTEGHQSALITLPSGKRILLPFDVGDFAENFAERILPGQACDDVAAGAAIDRLNGLCAREDVEMLLFHDPAAIQTIRLMPEFYD